MWNGPPEELAELLGREGLNRAYIVRHPESGELRPSHGALRGLAQRIAEERRDYRDHQGIFLEIGEESGHLLSAFLHRTHRGQGAGGVRYWGYGTVADWFRDGLRLSLGMGQKNALAGLWWGGGKGVIVRRPGTDHRDPDLRRAVFRDYGRFIASLRGCYVTAEDVGTTPEDIARIYTTTRYVTCVPPEVGGSGNPSVLTAEGVVVAMEAALEFLGRGTLEGKTVAMQGLGNVARYMIEDLIARRVERIVAVDIDPAHVDLAGQLFPDSPLEARLVSPDDRSIFAEQCDILTPNAVGAILDSHTIPEIRAAVVCGAANNQLADSNHDGAALAARGILYVPDFLANRMGIVNCANEQYGAFAGDPAVELHLRRETPHGIFQRALEVFRRARASGRSTAAEAEELADELAREPHPLWPDRGQQIIDHLVASGWEDSRPAATQVTQS